MLEEYADFCYTQIGGYTLDYIEYFEGLRPQLSKADIEISLPEYVSMIAFTAITVFVFGVFLLGTFMGITAGISGFIFAIVLSIIFSVGSSFLFYLYPSIVMKDRATKMRDTLPFATMYMATLAGTGTSISELFSNLSKTEEYGEISKEAQKINRDIETFGMDVTEALQRAAERTPSKDFKDLLWGINHTMTSGGSLRTFLHERSDTLMKDYQRRVKAFSEQLSLFVELYITLVIVGSIVFTSMSVVMSSFTGYSPNFIVIIQMGAIFLGLPVISGIFIFIVDSIAPGGIR